MSTDGVIVTQAAQHWGILATGKLCVCVISNADQESSRHRQDSHIFQALPHLATFDLMYSMNWDSIEFRK